MDDFKQETLDPQDWDEMRRLGHRMVDDMMDYLLNIRARPVWQPIPQDIRNSFKSEVPMKPDSPENVYREFKGTILPHPMGNIHPRFWGWVIGTGTPLGALAEFLAATMNPNVGGGDQVAQLVELQVIDWCRQIFDFPENSSGILTSGGSMANFLAIAAARNTRAEFDIRRDGLHDAPRKMVMFASSETHSSVTKAAEQLGLGRNGLVTIRVNDDFQIDLADLKAKYQSAVEAGNYPFCVVGNAGTVNTGAFDDLVALADFCSETGLWFHVDGAFGALARLVPEKAGLVSGMERADSLAFDLHKWMYMPIEVGCALIRREPDHRKAFSLTPEYLAHARGGIAASEMWMSDYGLQLSRSFRALKVWMSIKEHGLEKYARMIKKNCDQMQYLAQLVRAQPRLELLSPVELNIVCFRYVIAGWSDKELNTLNEDILIQLQERGLAAPSSTTLNGKYAIRAANVNHRSLHSDFDFLVQQVVCIGDSMTGENLTTS